MPPAEQMACSRAPPPDPKLYVTYDGSEGKLGDAIDPDKT